MKIASTTPFTEASGSAVNETETWRVFQQYGEDSGQPLSAVRPLHVPLWEPLAAETATGNLIESTLQRGKIASLWDYFTR